VYYYPAFGLAKSDQESGFSGWRKNETGQNPSVEGETDPRAFEE
jgi:hypothetical protein